MSRRPRNWDTRTGHVAPLEPGSARYVAHIEGRSSVIEDHREPFDDVGAAVAWARERAPVVLVRLDGEEFERSAGAGALGRAPPEPIRARARCRVVSLDDQHRDRALAQLRVVPRPAVQARCSASAFSAASPSSRLRCSIACILARKRRTGQPSHDSSDVTLVRPSRSSRRWT
jgi:hypothetical protein